MGHSWLVAMVVRLIREKTGAAEGTGMHAGPGLIMIILERRRLYV